MKNLDQTDDSVDELYMDEDITTDELRVNLGHSRFAELRKGFYEELEEKVDSILADDEEQELLIEALLDSEEFATDDTEGE